MDLIDLLFGCAFGLTYSFLAVSVLRLFRRFVAPMRHRAAQVAGRT
jgi:hypothetical protein